MWKNGNTKINVDYVVGVYIVVIATSNATRRENVYGNDAHKNSVLILINGDQRQDEHLAHCQ